MRRSPWPPRPGIAARKRDSRPLSQFRQRPLRAFPLQGGWATSLKPMMKLGPAISLAGVLMLASPAFSAIVPADSDTTPVPSAGGSHPHPHPVPTPTPSTGNPLWAIPLSLLTATRDRPLFSVSRRPPVVAAPTVAPPPQHQALAPPSPGAATAYACGDGRQPQGERRAASRLQP
jgi:hypothetical protein